jgi:flagellar assembly protein FliH
MKSLSRSRILKPVHYCETEAVTMGIKVLRSGSRQEYEPGSLRTPPGLTLEEWRDLVAEIEAKAKEKAQSIIREAEDEAERIKESAREDGHSSGRAGGYEEGYAAGRQEALAQCQAEWSHRLECISRLCEEITGFRSALIERYRSEIVDLVIEVARAVICSEVDRDDRAVLSVIETCLRKASSPSTLKIKTNVADLAAVTEAKRELAARFPAVQTIEVIDDPGVERGGCLIEMDNGFLDARIGHQLDRIRDAMVRSLEEADHD